MPFEHAPVVEGKKIRKFLKYTVNEVQEVCPEIDSLPGASDGFGLLHVSKHYLPKIEISYCFIPDVMQSFLAALHISTLDNEEQVIVMKESLDSKQRGNSVIQCTLEFVDKSKCTVTEFKKECHKGYVEEESAMIMNSFEVQGAKHKTSCVLKELNLSHNKISCTGAIAISQIIRECYSLLMLNISHNNINCKGIRKIAEALQGDKQLQYLDISYNDISDQGVIAVNEYLMKNNTLLEFRMVQTLTNKRTRCLKIDDTICLNKTLQILDVSFNKIPDNEVLKISRSFKYNNALKVVKLSWESYPYRLVLDTSAKSCIWDEHGIGDIGAQLVSDFLLHSTTVQTLGISFIGLSTHGAAAISKCLKESTSLLKINLANNRITSKGAEQIAIALQINKSVNKLNISDNDIADDGAIAISECIKCSTLLEELNISHNSINVKGAMGM
ncbi:NLR family CARD domain-containing protein 3-like [Dysidea avara]|uniref:NLR family CARD domain-containing protein 3-like n=1 Tax=Dysidea avara TaxID=196820 RepID=UPI003328C01B